MRVYRVETDDGTGPYLAVYNLAFAGHPVNRLVREIERHQNDPARPAPWDDAIRPSSCYHYAFVNLDALWRWFGNAIDIPYNGLLVYFNVVEYRVKDGDYQVGRSGQVAFLRPLVESRRILTIAEVINARPLVTLGQEVCND